MDQRYASAQSTTSHDSAQPMLSGVPWPTNVCLDWPPYLCINCWGMKFYYNTRMAQCFHCGYIMLNWGCKDAIGDLAQY